MIVYSLELPRVWVTAFQTSLQGIAGLLGRDRANAGTAQMSSKGNSKDRAKIRLVAQG
jgi:hypothetical protein